MKQFVSTCLVFSLFALPNLSYSQCAEIIKEDKNIGGVQVLSTNPQTIVVRGTYTYSIDFRIENSSIVSKVYSKGGELFNQNDELIFIDDNKNRRSYRFVEMGEMIRDGGTPVHQNTLEIDLAALDWFAQNDMEVIFIKNNVKNQMLKFTVNDSRQTDFKNMASCFSSKLDRTKINDKPLSGAILSSGGAVSRTTSASVNPDGTPASGGVRKVADVSQLNDEELGQLYEELQATKQRVRDEIKAENERLEKYKAQIQEEITFAREQGQAEKTKFAQEVLEARWRSQEEIENARKESAAIVAETKQRASGEMENIQSDVIQARERANEAIQKAKITCSHNINFR